MFFFFFSKPYISIVGEVIGFKKIADKDEAERQLGIVLNEINRAHEEGISAKFMPTANGEFQGLICRGANIMQIILEIKNKMYPMRLRFGIGVGEITTKLESEKSVSVNGPGHDKAREALEFLRGKAGKNKTAAADVRMDAVGDNQARMSLVNTIFSLMTTLEYGWSARQREIICDMMKYQDGQTGVAKRLGITQSTVQKSLTAAHYYTYEDALKTLESVFAEIGDRNYGR